MKNILSTGTGAVAALLILAAAPAGAQESETAGTYQISDLDFTSETQVSFPTQIVAEGPKARRDSHRVFYIMPKVGTLGYGVDLGFRPLEKVGVRALWRDYSQDFDFDAEGENLKADIDIGGYGAVLDVHPTGGNFRMSGGIFKLDNNAGLETTIESTIDVDGSPVQAEADVEGEIDYNRNAPFLSIGWHDYLGNHVSYDISLGAVYQGQPDVRLESTGGLAAGFPDVEQDIDDIEQEIEDSLEGFSFYPVLEFGVTIHF